MSENKENITLPNMSEVIVSSSPHLHSDSSISKIMLMVIISLLPACLAGVYYFGFDAVRVLLLTIGSCLAVEAVWCTIAKKQNPWKDGSSILTGLLLGMNLSASSPWWICFLGACLAIILGKEIFGGLGNNPFNPALVARVGLLIGFTTPMTTWVSPVDGSTCATPLGMTFEQLVEHKIDIVSNLLVGNVAGCIGETSALALLIGGALLIGMKIIKWHIPVSFIGTVFVFTAICHYANPAVYIPPMYHVLSGGLILGAIFMATDMVTSPLTEKGMIVFGIGCGIVTCLIRLWASYPEGVSFAILFMNALVPLIDDFTQKKPFGAAEAEAK
jgi:electron transport complex protein RnfD